MIDVNNIVLIKNKSKIYQIIKSIFSKSSYFFVIVALLLLIISTRAYITKIGYELAVNNEISKEIKLENKILHSEISKLKSNSRLKKEALKNNMKFPKKEDIKILRGSEVIKILSDKKEIIGVELENGDKIDANNVICNADPPGVYSKLANAENSNSIFNWKMKRMEYSMGLFVYYFGSKKIYSDVEHHTIKFGDRYKEHLDDIFNNKKLNDDISYYLHRPTATDKSMAPKNHDCFYVLVPVPNNQSGIDWSIEGEKMKKLVVKKMEESLLPNLSENIVEDFYLTPDYFEKELNTKYGSGFSIQPKFSQSAYFRFHNKSEIYDGLYFVGAGTHPGAGVPGVLSSAKVLDKIL